MARKRPSPEAVKACLDIERLKQTGIVDAEAVTRYGAFVGSVIECHDSLPRAMDHARTLIAAAGDGNTTLASGTVVLADTMSLSRGRFRRIWHAPPGGVWGCMVHRNTLLPQSRRFIPFAAGLSCCEAMRIFGGRRAVLRWVNDVLIDGRKVAGFLVESHTEPARGEEFTLVGFGININNSSFPHELSGLAGSLRMVTGRKIDITEFTNIFLSRMAWNFGLLYHEEARETRGEKFSGTGGKHILLENWLKATDSVGRNVIYGFDVMTSPQYRGRVHAVDDDGGLVLRLEDGRLRTEYAGEIRYLEKPSDG